MKHLVILSSYNRPRLVQRAIASVLTQTHGDLLLFVADDGSNAETLDSINASIVGDQRATVLSSSEPREGAMADPTVRAVACINNAIALAKRSFRFDLVHYLPDDDWFAPGRMEAFDKFFSSNPHAHVAYGRMRYVQDGRGEVGELFKGVVLTDPSCLVDHGQFCHRASCLTTDHPWPSSEGDYCFDASFFRTLTAAGRLFYPVNAIVNYKFQHAKNLQKTGVSNVDDRE